MTVNDGAVVGTTQIVDSGPRNERWNVVMLGDGYQQAQLAGFADDCRAFVDTLFATAPFGELQQAINVFRIDVWSTDAGADDPVACGGTGATAATYFDATFCGFPGVQRMLTVNNVNVRTVASAQVPEWNTVLVVVNSTIYGGSGGAVGTFSLASDANQIAIHELGHTLFGLADEYEYLQGCDTAEIRTTHPTGEPAQPNVTTNRDRATLKWGDLVAATTPIPTTTNPDCAHCDTQASPVAAGTVGDFEGADTWHCGAFRPEFDCKMRHLAAEFCAVCARRIQETLAPFVGAWRHFSPIAGHPIDADLDCFGGPRSAQFAVAGDFDGDGRDEIAACASGAGDASAGNDFWVMDYDPAAGAWPHLGAIAGHPIAADIDCFGGPRSAQFAVAGDFDGDGRDEIAASASGAGDASAGNDFWVMDYDPAAGAWQHLSAIAGHPIAADVDCFGGPRSAQFAVAGDFDGDQRDEIAACASGAGDASAGNDFWVMDYDPAAGTWQHLGAIPGHPIAADVDCYGGPRSAKFAVVGDFDGDGRDEIAVCASGSGNASAGNDFWVMDFDPAAGTWQHLGAIPGHPIAADVDCYGGPRSAQFAVVGDFDGDGRDEIAVCASGEGNASAGNDFWVMDYDPVAGTWQHLSQDLGHPIEADFDCFSGPRSAAFAVVAGDFDRDGRDEVAVCASANEDDSAGNDFWVMDYDPAARRWRHLSPITHHPIGADVDCYGGPRRARFAVAGDFDGDGRHEIAACASGAGNASAGNDFWVMEYAEDMRRLVTQTQKAAGDIVALCRPGSAWSPVSKAQAITDIETGRAQYFVPTAGGRAVAVEVVDGPTGKYLRTEPDATTTNNLDQLPDC